MLKISKNSLNKLDEWYIEGFKLECFENLLDKDRKLLVDIIFGLKKNVNNVLIFAELSADLIKDTCAKLTLKGITCKPYPTLKTESFCGIIVACKNKNQLETTLELTWARVYNGLWIGCPLSERDLEIFKNGILKGVEASRWTVRFDERLIGKDLIKNRANFVIYRGPDGEGLFILSKKVHAEYIEALLTKLQKR